MGRPRQHMREREGYRARLGIYDGFLMLRSILKGSILRSAYFEVYFKVDVKVELRSILGMFRVCLSVIHGFKV